MHRTRAQRPLTATRTPRAGRQALAMEAGNGDLHQQLMMVPKRPRGRGKRTVWFQWFDGAGELHVMALSAERSQEFLRAAH